VNAAVEEREDLPASFVKRTNWLNTLVSPVLVGVEGEAIVCLTLEGSEF
jgi:hypothetical protein